LGYWLYLFFCEVRFLTFQCYFHNLEVRLLHDLIVQQTNHVRRLPQISSHILISITALARIGRVFNYTLVYCESHGVNLFFVRDDVFQSVRDLYPNAGKPAALFRPPRYRGGRGWAGAVPPGKEWIVNV
jgi:hypothetical protein